MEWTRPVLPDVTSKQVRSLYESDLVEVDLRLLNDYSYLECSVMTLISTMS